MDIGTLLVTLGANLQPLALALNDASDRFDNYAASGGGAAGRVAQAFESGVGTINSTLNSASQPFADFAKGIEVIDAALLALTAGGLAYAYVKANDFESATADLYKVLGDDEGRIGEAQQMALDLADAYGVSASNILQSAANFKQAGFDYSGSALLVKDSLDLMIAGDMEAAQAADLIVRALKGFQEPASEARRLIDVLNEVSNNYATNVKELGAGMATIAPIAKLMGFTFEETAGILTPVIEVFQSGNEAATALKTGLLRLSDDSKPVTDALKALGVAQKESNGQMKSGKDILAEVQKAFVNLTEAEKLYYAKELSGIHQAGKMVIVFDQLEKQLAITGVAMGAFGSAAKEVEIRLATGEIAVKRLVTGFENLSVSAGRQFQAAATSAITGMTDIENVLSKSIRAGVFDDVFGIVRDFANELGSDLKEIAKNLPVALSQIDWTEFTHSFGGLKNSLTALMDAFFGGIDLTSIEGLKNGVQLIVDGFSKLMQVSEGLAESFIPIFTKFGDWIREGSKVDEETMKMTGLFLGFGQQLNFVTGALPYFGAALSAVAGSSMINAVANVGGLVASLGPGVLGLAGAAGGAALALGGILYYNEEVSTGVKYLNSLLDPLNKFFFGIEEAVTVTGEAMEQATWKIHETSNALRNVPEETKISMTASESEDFKRIMELLEQSKIEDHKMNVSIITDLSPITELQNAIRDTSGKVINLEVDNSKALTSIGAASELMNDIAREYTADFEVDVKDQKYNDAKAKLDDLAKVKEVEIKLKGEIDKDLAKIKYSAENLQHAMEWTAKIQIEEAENNLKILEAALNSVNTTMGSVGTNIGSLFGKIPSETSQAFKLWMASLNQQLKIQDEGWNIQKKLLETQLKYMEAKNKRLSSGQPLIQIDCSGLEPELEMVMWKVIEKVQIRGAEEASEFLLGI